ncbi:EF-hand calcium-binding domain-containing protein 6 [Spea bombifrons]|uniref:EF-hand calcium-binding domain-containing protein 6 n=1 Tax=Spea bombifrons TaxID=233779 RepID=UPI0023494CB0|nr:EF-hand calcium-binding domain-containing protein 6 [Spea bombifrons]
MHSRVTSAESFNDLRPQTRGITFAGRPPSTPGKYLSRSSSASSVRSSQISSVISAPDPSLSVSDVEKILQRRVTEIGEDLRNAFMTLDADQSFAVTKGEFYRVLRNFVLPLTQTQFDALLAKIPILGNGAVPYLKFLEMFHRAGGRSAQGKNVKRRWSLAEGNQVLTLNELETQLRHMISKNLKNVVRSCRLFDYNQNGQIQKHELRRILESHCFKMKNAEYEKLWNQYCVGKRNTLDYREMLRNLGLNSEAHSQPVKETVAEALNWESVRLAKERQNVWRPSSSSRGPAAEECTAEDLEAAFRKAIPASYSSLIKAFRTFDAANSGYIALDDLKSVLNNFIFQLPNGAFLELMNRLGFKSPGSIQWERFLKAFQEPQPIENGQTLPIRPNHKVNPVRGTSVTFPTDHILHKLRNHLQESYHSLKEAFLVLDEGRDGKVSRKELRRIVDCMLFRITDAQFKELMIVLDPEHTGFISYHQFLDLFEEKESVTGHKWLNNKRQIMRETPVQVSWDAMENILREKITSNWRGFSKALQTEDSKNQGIISRERFKRILQTHCPALSGEHLQLIYERYGDDSCQYIAYPEFLQNMGIVLSHAGDVNGVSTNIFNESQCREEFRQTDLSNRMKEIDHQASHLIRKITVDGVIEKLKESMNIQEFATKDSFLACKKQKNGKVTKADFRKVLEDHRIHLDDDQFDELAEKLGFTGEGLGYLDFVSLFQVPTGEGPGDVLQNSPNHRVNRTKFHYTTAEECLSRLAEKLHEGYEDSYSAFYKIDGNRDGIVSMHDLRRLLDSFMFVLTQKEFERLLGLLGLNLNSTLNYVEFLKLVQRQEKDDCPPWLNSFYRPKQTSDCADLACEQAHYYLVTKAQARWHDLAKTFCEFDSEGNGIIQKKDLRNVLFRFSLPITSQEFEKLWNRYDPEGKGHLSHAEFLQKLGVHFAPADGGPSQRIADNNRESLLKHYGGQQKMAEDLEAFHRRQTKALDLRGIEQQIKDKFREYYQDFAAAFAKMDKNKDGFITVQDFRRTLEEMNFYLDDDQFDNLLCRLRIRVRDRKFSYFDFLRVVDDGRASKYGQKPSGPPDRFPDLSPPKALGKLREAIAASYDELYKAFSAVDADAAGSVKPPELRRILDSFCFKLTDEQFERLLREAAPRVDHTIDWRAFLRNPPAPAAQSASSWVEKVQKATGPKSSQKLTTKDILTRIQEVVGTRSDAILQEFAERDYANIHVISKEDFRETFSRNFLLLTDEQFENLWNSLPLNPYGNLKYRDFLKKFRPEIPSSRNSDGEQKLDRSLRYGRPKSGSMSGIRRPKTAPPVLNKSNIGISRPHTAGPLSTPIVNCDGVESKLRTDLQKVWQEIHKICRTKDPESLGEVTVTEFIDVMSRFGVDLTSDDLHRLLTKYDSRNNGKFSYSDFLRNLVFAQKPGEATFPRRMKLPRPRVPMSSGAQGPVFLEAMLRIQPKIRDCWRPMRRAFVACDDPRTGYITIPDFKQVLQKFGINLSEDEFFHIAGYFDKDLESKISYNDFLSEFLR